VALSQNDSVNKQNDSINTSLIQAFNKTVIIEAQRLTDSIKSGIRKTTTFFKTTDNLKET
jgi:predicted nucleic acid-binding protein